jgi:hypothetical protein
VAGLLALDSIRGSPSMRISGQPYFVFPIFGLFSGLCSGVSIVLPGPFLFIAPGFFFGVAIANAFDASVRRLTTAQWNTIAAASTVGYIAALVSFFLSSMLPAIDNGLLSGAFLGAIAGSAGGLFVAISIANAISASSPVRTLLLIPSAGALFGAAFIVVGVYLSDHTPLRHPFDDFVSYAIWQSGVASVCPACLCRSADNISTEPTDAADSR